MEKIRENMKDMDRKIAEYRVRCLSLHCWLMCDGTGVSEDQERVADGSIDAQQETDSNQIYSVTTVMLGRVSGGVN